MLTVPFRDITLPALGLGCMRLPTDEEHRIKTDEVRAMVTYAMAHGVNYFDTGYDYHGGKSETTLGEVLADYPRASYRLADKYPGYSPRNWRRVEAIFEEQLRRCRTDYFDFYLFHNLSELNVDAYLDPKYGIFDYLARQKEEGRIRHLGLSVHGSTETLARFLAVYGTHMEFCQIQLNYLDYEFQKAHEKLALLAEYGIPVFVMEPLRGGRLCTLQAPFDDRMREAFPDRRPHEVAFRFLQSLPQVTLTLSGMSSMEQLRDNIALFSERKPLTDAEREALLALAADITAVGTVPCTGCGYCTEHCPAGLDIPRLMGYYNEHTFSGGGFIVPSAVESMERSKRPTACLGCRQCESVCPQGIKVADILASLCEKLDLKT